MCCRRTPPPGSAPNPTIRHSAPTIRHLESTIRHLESTIRHLEARVGAYCHHAGGNRPVVGLSVGGLVKHVALTERSWTGNILQRESELDFDSYADTFRLSDGETLGSVIALYDDVAAETSEVIAGIQDLGHPVPVPPAPWNLKDVKEWSVRWVRLHMIEETARHAGHADIIRETVDGATFYPLLAASEGWPETDWLKPWRPETPG